MNILDLASLIQDSFVAKPPKKLLDHCGQYYDVYYNLFYLAAKEYKDLGCAVELGVDQGRGSLAFVLGGCKTFGIDHTRKVGVETIDRYRKFTFINKDTLPVPDEIEGQKIALLHIDTEHSWSMAAAEFDAYKPYLIDEALVFFDDLSASEHDVRNYFRHLTAYQKIEFDDLHPSCGFGVLLYKKDDG